MRSGAAWPRGRSGRRFSLVDEFLESLQRGDTYFLAGRFCLEHHFFAVERIDPFTRLRGRLLHDFHLQKAWQREQAVTAQAFLDRGGKRVKHGSDLLLRELCFLRNGSENFRLGRCCILFRHINLLMVFANASSEIPTYSTRRRK